MIVVTRVEDAFARVPRTDFIPGSKRDQAGYDAPVSIGGGQTNSQPSTVRRMLELLDVQAGQRVLDIGAGSGWTTALLSELTGQGGFVLGLELDPELAQWGSANLAGYDAGRVRLETADSEILGRPAEAPWERILVSAATPSVPQQLIDQLSDDGLMVIPVDGALTTVSIRSGDPHIARHGAYRFVPLRGSWKN